MITFKRFLLLAGFIFLLFFGIPIRIQDQVETDFNDYLTRFNKSYENETEYQIRLQAFQTSLEKIRKLNSLRKSNLSATYGLTAFSDMFEHEFLEKHLQKDRKHRHDRKSSGENSSEEEDEKTRRYVIEEEANGLGSSEEENHKSGKNGSGRAGREVEVKMNSVLSRSFLQKVRGLPRVVDWRLKGFVSPVNNQRSCGACWAFSTIENLETMLAIKTGRLTRLSTQQMIDCAGYNNKGCKGGDMCDLLDWLMDYSVKVVPEEQYPLRLETGRCRDSNSTDGVQVTKYVCSDLIDNEDYILATLAFQGPVAAAINALSWQNYLGGVIQYHCSSHPLLLNHAVQIVGYNLDSETPHYIVRNSWGEDFGDQGYLYIAIGSNLCGLANEVSAVQV